MTPCYLETYRREPGLTDRIARGLEELASCRACPRNCDVDRMANKTAACHTGRLARVASSFPHFGEEDCLRGWAGSGTIFFSYCNLRCVFCCHPDTIISSVDGPRRIADLFDEATDRVPLGDGWAATPAGRVDAFVRPGQSTRSPIVRIYRRHFRGDLVKIKAYNCPPLQLTPEHEVFVANRRTGDVQKVRAGDLERGHYLIVPKRSARRGKYRRIDAVAVLAGATCRRDSCKREMLVPLVELAPLLTGDLTSQQVAERTGYHPAYVRTLRSRLRRGRLTTITRPAVARTRVVVEGDRVRYQREHRPGIPRHLALDDRLAWLLGFYCAEGHVTVQKSRPNSARLVFSFGHHERERARRVIELLTQLFGVTATEVERVTTVTVEAGKTSAARFFAELCGKGARTKCVPQQVLDSPRRAQRAFLDGYLAGDGTERPRHLVATTVSPTLAWGLYELGLRLGVLPSYARYDGPARTRIQGREVSQAPLHYVKFKKDRLAGRPDGRERTKWIDDGERYLVPVFRVERVPYEGPVYDLEVAHADHSYLASWMAISNCQNHDISQADAGVEVRPEQLASLMLELQERGCHNINFVTPEHVVPQLLEALPHAIEGGLRVPLVYNTSGYDALHSLELMDGLIDIYMPDLKFWDTGVSKRLVKAADYPQIVRDAIAEMQRQVGDLTLDADGLAVRGLLVRHLVMPRGLAGTREAMTWLRDEVSPRAYVNVMDQYRPDYRAEKYPEIDRRTRPVEHLEAVDIARELGLRVDERDPHPRLRARLGYA